MQNDSQHGPPVIVGAIVSAPDFEERVDAFKEYYSANYPRLIAAEQTLRNLLHLLTSDVSIEEPKVSSRLKERNECIKKFSLKYRDELERKGQQYNIQDHITDLIGIRIICLYETDIPPVEAVIRANFDVISVTNKTKSLVEQVDTFGYKGLHLDVRMNDARRQFSEYRKFEDLRFEIQIRSIVQDAWSEVDHRLKYKKQIPDILKRRIVRLAAIFELADQEFVSIRDETQRLEEKATGASEQEAQDASADMLDSFSFLSVMKSRHPGYNFDPIKIQGFVDELKEMAPEFHISELRAAIDENSELIKEYAETVEKKNGFRLNPFTKMRHILYCHDENMFDRMLWPRQRDTFLRWLDEQTEVKAAE
jgi:GTP pyrophosphokinase